MKPLKFAITSASILIASLSSPVFAAQDCSTYIPSINKQMTSYLAAAGSRAMKNVSLDEFGNMVDPMWGRPIVKLDTYVLPESISKNAFLSLHRCRHQGCADRQRAHGLQLQL